MAKNLFQLKAMQASFADQVKVLSAKYEDMLGDPKATMEERKAAKAELDDINDRFDSASEQVTKAETEMENKLRGQKEVETITETPSNKAVKSYANMVRNIYKNGTSVGIEQFKNETSVQGVGEPSGDSFLPITLDNELVSEPTTPNPLRVDATFSTLVNLRLPRVSVDFGDTFKTILDGEAAKEATLKGDQITFGRHESKVRIGLTDTLLSGSDLGLVQYAQSQLENAASELELARAFAETPVSGEENMSFYDKTVGIKEVKGATLFEAINGSLDDLNDSDRNVAKIYMTPKDFGSIKKELANNSATLWAATPETIFGVPVQLTSWAKTPVVGNFSQYQGNYDPQGSIMEQYRKPETGTTYVQITLWYDAQVRRASAFRKAIVNP